MEEKLCISLWGLPKTIVKQYEKMGITQLYDWQAECLCTGNVLGGGNIVYSAPTSAGKTMVAEMLVLKQVLEKKRKALIVLPFVSVAREKMFYLQKLYQDAGIKVGGFMGNYNTPGGLSSTNVAVCTIEKANSLVNRLLLESKLCEIGVIVVDELHMVGDFNRGYLLELLLAKVMFASERLWKKGDGLSNICSEQIQIIGMSATLPNLDLLAKWLKADLYVTNFRPVPLREFVKIGQSVYDEQLEKVWDINNDYIVEGDDDHVIPLCIETVLNEHCVLIFCPTRSWCEKLCETIAKEFYAINHGENYKEKNDTRFNLKVPLNYNALGDIKRQLHRTPSGLDNLLGKTIPNGVAYHHAGLTFEERAIIEGAFRGCHLKVLIATSTLSSGVNLPARRVIIRTPIFHNQVIDTLVYKQMTGRAGRKGVDSQGESILICKESQKDKVSQLLQSNLPPVKSCLLKDSDLNQMFKRAVLEIVASGLAETFQHITEYISFTLMIASIDDSAEKNCSSLVESCLLYLTENELIQIKTKLGVEYFYSSKLGLAVLASALSPDEGLGVFEDLQKARRCFVLETELHVIYLITPIYSQEISSNINWYHFYEVWENLPPSMKKVAEFVGVEESFIGRAIRGVIKTKTSSQLRSLAIHQRFYTAMLLSELVDERPFTELLNKYGCSRGQLSALQQSSASFAGMVTIFCNKLGWNNLELLLSQFQSRLLFGIQRELCDLVRITALTSKNARTLYNAGFQTVASLVNATPVVIEELFLSSDPFESNKLIYGESEWEAEQRIKSRCVWLCENKAVTLLEAALIVIEEAKSIVKEELGCVDIQWTENIQDYQVKEKKVLKSTKKLKRKTSSFCKSEDHTNVMFLSPPQSYIRSGIIYSKSSQRKEVEGNEDQDCQINDPPSAFDQQNKFIHSLNNSFHRKKEKNAMGSKLFENIFGINTLNPKSSQRSLLDADKQIKVTQVSSEKSYTFSNMHSMKTEVSFHSPIMCPNKYMSQNHEEKKRCTPSNCFLKMTSKSKENSDVRVPKETLLHLNCDLTEDLKTPKDLKYLSMFNSEKTSTPRFDNLCFDEENYLGESLTMSMIEESEQLKDIQMDEKHVPACNTKYAFTKHFADNSSLTDYEKNKNKIFSRCHEIVCKDSSSSNNFVALTPPDEKYVVNSLYYTKKENPIEIKQTSINSPFSKNLNQSDGETVKCLEKNVVGSGASETGQDSFTVIDVCSNKLLFETFVKEWKSKERFSMSVACEFPIKKTKPDSRIGSNFLNKGDIDLKENVSMGAFGENVLNDECLIVGVAVSWEDRDVYYIALSPSNVHDDPDDTLLAENMDTSISLDEKLISIKDILEFDCQKVWVGFDIKKQYCLLAKGCGIVPDVQVQDPKIASWLLDPGAQEKNLFELVTNCLPTEANLLRGIYGNGTSNKYLSGRYTSATESVVILKLMDYYLKQLVKEELLKAFVEVEMQSIITVTRMELNGFGFSNGECIKQKELILKKLSALEEKAYDVVGHAFSLTSSEDVAKVLYLELRLPVNENISHNNRISTKRTILRPKYSTCKEMLEKLRHLHPLPDIILEWRRLSSTLYKQVFHLQQCSIYNKRLMMDRIFGNFQYFTSTGRISMREPNIQNITKDFDIELPDIIVDDVLPKTLMKKNLFDSDKQSSDMTAISMRHMFIPYAGCLILAADYSQLELRLIAHLSEDSQLLRILNDDYDVFKQIASQWLNVLPEKITPLQRQHAKKICYGMLYGIGTKSLGEQIQENEIKAGEFMDSFKSKFPGLQRYISSTIENCKKNGYVSTLIGRKRYLPLIRSPHAQSRARAERQAVNTTVQGSAADIVKRAMINIDQKLATRYPDTKYPHGVKMHKDLTISQLPCGAYLLLHLHDELIYEVSLSEIDQVKSLIKDEMENVVNLSVKLRVKVKIGESWASVM